MSIVETFQANMQDKIQKAIGVYKKELSGLRTGRASTSLLDPVTVESYGSVSPLNQVASISILDSRLLGIQVWDKNLIKAVEKAIVNANLGLNPSSDGCLIRIPIPPLNEERREEMIKVAGRFAEQAKVAIRSIRRGILDDLKNSEETISEDEMKHYEEKVQKITDDAVKETDEILKQKETEIKQI